MTRRANLPGADELFRSTAPALSAVPAQPTHEVAAPLVPPAIATPKAPSSKKGVRTIARRRVTTGIARLQAANVTMRKLLCTYPLMSSLIWIKHGYSYVVI